MNVHPDPTRLVPTNIEAEQAVIGCILNSNRTLDVVSGLLEPGHFYEPLHRTIFDVAARMIGAGKGVNPITIKHHLAEDSTFGPHDESVSVSVYLARLAAAAAPPLMVRDYAIAVHDAWVAREAIGALQQGVDVYYSLAPDKDPLEAFQPIEDKITRLRAERVRSENRRGAGREYLDEMNAAKTRGEVRGVPVCLREIEDVISEPRFEAGNLYGLLSSSGEGKTSLTIQIIAHALHRGHPVQFLSFDQSRVQCIRQMVAQEHSIEARRQRRPSLMSEKELESAVMFATWVDEQPLEVIKCVDQSAAQLVGYAKTFLKRNANGKVPLIVVDHIGSVRPEDKRADEGTKAKDINKVFKAGAELTESAWLVLNQRNSYGMKRDNPRPISADLFGGDPAKQAYDAIFYVYRFKKFLEERKAIASSDADWKKINKVFPSAVRENGEDIAEIGAIKVRYGNPDVKCLVTFEAKFTRYVSLEKPEQSDLLGEGAL